MKNPNNSLMPLSDIVKMELDMEDADFWLVRQTPHSEEVGKPMRYYSPDYIGVAVRPAYAEKLNSNYLYFIFDYYCSTGYWDRFTEECNGEYSVSVAEFRNLKVRRSYLNDSKTRV